MFSDQHSTWLVYTSILQKRAEYPAVTCPSLSTQNVDVTWLVDSILIITLDRDARATWLSIFKCFVSGVKLRKREKFHLSLIFFSDRLFVVSVRYLMFFVWKCLNISLIQNVTTFYEQTRNILSGLTRRNVINRI